jgi:hypothetical protein
MIQIPSITTILSVKFYDVYFNSLKIWSFRDPQESSRAKKKTLPSELRNYDDVAFQSAIITERAHGASDKQSRLYW